MRDFNINLLSSDTKPEVSAFFDNLPWHFLALYILQPTRLVENSKTLIDNIFINTREFVSYSESFTSQISDHLLQFVILKSFLRKLPSNQSDSFERNCKFFNDDEFKDEMKNILWKNILTQMNILASITFDVFSTILVLYLNNIHHYINFLKKEKNLLKQNHESKRELTF